MERTQSKQNPKPKSGNYLIKHELFWSVGLALLSAFFAAGVYIGNTKFDKNLIELSDTKKALEDTIRIRENLIKNLRHNSDSALNILGHMPYNEMTLDTLSFKKVQSNIEHAGAVLYLNK